MRDVDGGAVRCPRSLWAIGIEVGDERATPQTWADQCRVAMCCPLRLFHDDRPAKGRDDAGATSRWIHAPQLKGTTIIEAPIMVEISDNGEAVMQIGLRMA